MGTAVSAPKRALRLDEQQLKDLEDIRREILEAHRDNPEVPSHISREWHKNLHHGGDGVKWMLEYLEIPSITPPAVMVPIPVNRDTSANRIPQADGHQAKRVALKRLDEFVTKMRTSRNW